MSLGIVVGARLARPLALGRGNSQVVDYAKIAESLPDPEPSNSAPIAPKKGRKLRVKALGKDREYLPLDHQKYQGIAAAKGYAQGEDFSGNRLQRVHYSHEAMIDVIIAEPTITQKELARKFGRSMGWISIVMGSDAFQAALAKRRDDLMDPEFVATLEDRFKGLADQSLRVISEALERTNNTDLALKGLEISSRAMGFGARGHGGQVTNNTFVVALPPKQGDATEWADHHRPMKQLPSGE